MDENDTPSAWAEFRDDLVSAFRVWARYPVLPVLSVALSSGYLLLPRESPLGVLVLPVIVFSVGWPGMERIWYLRAFRNQPITASDVWRLTWRFFWPFVRLGLLMACLFVPLAIPYVVVHGWWPLALITAVSAGVDVALTFVVPDLTFSTPNVLEALRWGIPSLKEWWPADLLFVAVPPLAAQIVARVSGLGSPGSFGFFLASALAALVGLLAKGAITAFYLRRIVVEGDGWVGRRSRAPARPG